MRVAIIGAGNVRSAIAEAAARTGHEAIVAAKEPSRAEDLAKRLSVEKRRQRGRGRLRG